MAACCFYSSGWGGGKVGGAVTLVKGGGGGDGDRDFPDSTVSVLFRVATGVQHQMMESLGVR